MLPRLRRGEQGLRTYRLPTSRRGVYELGPVEIPRADPFGLCRTVQRMGAPQRIAVHPRVLPLHPLPDGHVAEPGRPVERHVAPGHGHLPPPARVRGRRRPAHWCTGRRRPAPGKLVVRHNVDTAQPYTVVLADLRPEVYSAETFEEAIDVTASLAASMSAGKAPVQLRTTAGERVGGPGHRDPGALVDYLTDLAPSSAGSLSTQLVPLRHERGGSALVVVTGTLEVESLPAIAALRRRFDHVIVASSSPAALRPRPTRASPCWWRPKPTNWPKLGTPGWPDDPEGHFAEAHSGHRSGRCTGPGRRGQCLAGGHALATGIPGVGRCLAARLGGRAAHCDHCRRLPLGGLRYHIHLRALSHAGCSASSSSATTSHFSSIGSGLAHVPAQLLTETLPLSGGNYLLAAPMVLTWLCASASAESLLRPARPAAMGLAAPLVCFALAFAATTSAPAGHTVAEGAGLFGAVVVGALVRQGLILSQIAQAREDAGGSGADGRRARRHSSLRRALTGTVLAALLAGALAVGVSSVPSLASKPASLTRSTQLLSGTVVDPLDTLASLRDSDPAARPTSLFSLQVDQPWSGYISLATLDRYDGDSWTFSATFRPTGGRVPSTQATSEPGDHDVVQQYTLEHSIGLPFLPALDRPVQVDGLAVDADATTGMLAASVSTPASYTVMSRVPISTSTGLAAPSSVASGPDVPGGNSTAYTALPSSSTIDVAAAVRFAANLTGQQATPTFAFLQSVAAALAAQEKRVSPRRSSGAQSDPAALAGTSLAQVMNAVTVDRAATPEQFATFFAVVARYLGLPVRVVTGFRAPAAAGSSRPLAPGGYTLTNRDAWTWDEIPVVGYGWVVVDPTPVLTTADPSAPPEQVKASVPTKPKQASALPGKGAAHAIAKPVKVKLKQHLQVNWLLGLGIVLPALVIIMLLGGGFGLPALRRRLRRSARHRSDDPSVMAAGAWLELIDGLSRLGLDIDRSATSTDVVAELAGRFGEDFAPPARLVAAVADRALYCTEWPVDGDGAQLAWASQQELYRRLRHGVGRRDQARALMLVGAAPARARTGATR